MLRLHIMRHAKSSWAQPGTTDVERVLNERGENDLPKLAAAFSANQTPPEHIYCSASMRTKLTCEGLVAGMKETPDIEYLPQLYTGLVNDYLDVINNHGGDGPLMIIGHNPTCGMLVEYLCHNTGDEAFDAIANNYPTGAISTIEFDVNAWQEVGHASGRLVDVIVPRKL